VSVNCWLLSQDRAVRFLFENLEAVSNWGDILQMAVLELIRKVWSLNNNK
jgi:hypothetical protein